jgi:hypothetical protein
MNRIVLIGNGFDLAHSLKTSYQDFIEWYWDQRVDSFISIRDKVSEDILCKLTILGEGVWSTFAYDYTISPKGKHKGCDIIQAIRDNKDFFKVEDSPFFKSIIQSINTKKWVDIEEEYYKLLTQYAFEENAQNKLITLNNQLKYIQDLLVEYLTTINDKELSKQSFIYSKIYSPINIKDIAVGSVDILKQYVEQCVERDEKWINNKIHGYGAAEHAFPEDHSKIKESFEKHNNVLEVEIPRPYLLPHSVLLLNFNYTHTVQLYHNNKLGIVTNIHGSIEEPQSVIFGYGDELDERYNKIKETDNDECRRNIKSIKYLESANYRDVLSFMESAPYQIYIMGHSCGKSDRTLLNTLFEHKNCISIKPFYYKKEDGTDNYLELAQNISRNFKDMKLMRDRVVNKTYCETITP